MNTHSVYQNWTMPAERKSFKLYSVLNCHYSYFKNCFINHWLKTLRDLRVLKTRGESRSKEVCISANLHQNHLYQVWKVHSGNSHFSKEERVVSGNSRSVTKENMCHIYLIFYLLGTKASHIQIVLLM